MHRNSIPSNKSESILGFFVSSIPRVGFLSFATAPRTARAGEHSTVTITPRTSKFRRPLTKTSLESLNTPLFRQKYRCEGELHRKAFSVIPWKACQGRRPPPVITGKSDWAADALLVILRSEATKNLLRSNRLILTRADPSLCSEPALSWKVSLESTRADPSLR